MEENNYCEICGAPGEQHHIIFRRKSSAMINAKINHKYLCGEHHRGNDSPHLNRKIDIKYKLELQKKLFQLFQNNYYREAEIAELLEIKSKEVGILVKTLEQHSQGYERLDIVIACMGGKLYAN